MAGDSGQEHELLDWLKHYTFPLEAKFKDESFAERVYRTVVRRIVDAGVSPLLILSTERTFTVTI